MDASSTSRPQRGDLERHAVAFQSLSVDATLRLSERTRTVCRAVAAAALVGLIANFSMHLVNLRMQNLQFGGPAISLSVAVQAFAICLSALAAQRLIARTGLRCTLGASSLLCSIALVAIFCTGDIYAINALRVAFAIGLTFLVIASEYLVTARCESSNRGSVIGWYMTALGAGTIIGPFLVGIMGTQDLTAWLIGAAMLLLAATLLRACLSEQEGKTDRRAEAERRTGFFTAIGFMPKFLIAAFIFGMADNGGLSLLPIYGALNGYDTSSAANLAMFAAVGATLLQFPIGWLAARQDTTRLLINLAVCSICLLAVLPLVIDTKWSTCLVAVGLGATIEGIYTVALVGISGERRIQSLAGLNAAFISMCSLGEVAGPLASGISMEYLGLHGFIVALLAVFAVYALALMNRGAARPAHSLNLY
jgi:MFS family permease